MMLALSCSRLICSPINSASIVNDGAGGATAVGVWNLSAADVLNLRLDYIYVNFHTDANPAGEIRGNLIPAS